jgi:hypothetical protein
MFFTQRLHQRFARPGEFQIVNVNELPQLGEKSSEPPPRAPNRSNTAVPFRHS